MVLTGRRISGCPVIGCVVIKDFVSYVQDKKVERSKPCISLLLFSGFVYLEKLSQFKIRMFWLPADPGKETRVALPRASP